MKKITLIIIGLSFAFFAIHSCKKSDINGFGSGDGLVLGSYVQLDSLINTSLNFSQPTATVSMKLGATVGSPIASINIYVATGSNAADPTGWVLIKNVPYSNGVVLTVSTTELATALAPNVITPGNNYILQNEVVTKDGRKFSVANTPSTYNSFPAYNMGFSWYATAVCPFVASDAAGTYKVVTDTWVDYKLGTLISVTAGPGANEITMPIYPGPLGPPVQAVPVVVDVDPVTDIATIKSQVTGYYGSVDPGNLTTLTGTGYVFSCAGYITFNMTINIGGSVYSGYTFTVSKQ